MPLVDCRPTINFNFDSSSIKWSPRCQNSQILHFCIWENLTKIQLLMVFLALVGRWPPSSSLKFDARQRWRPNPTLHLMHSTNPPGPVPLRAASQPQNFNRLDPTRPRLEELPRALHSLRPFLLVCRQMIYMARRNQTRPRWVRKGQLGAGVSHDPPGQ